MADLGRPHLGQLDYLALIHMSLILQQVSQTCFDGNGRGQGGRKPIMQAHFKSLFISGLLTFHWLRKISSPLVKISSPIQSQDRNTLQSYMANNVCSERAEELRPLMQPINPKGFHIYAVLHSTMEVTFLMGLRKWVDCHEMEEWDLTCLMCLGNCLVNKQVCFFKTLYKQVLHYVLLFLASFTSHYGRFNILNMSSFPKLMYKLMQFQPK